MSEWYRLNDDGTTTPITLEERCADERKEDKRRVAATDIIDKLWISTVFLGLDHSWSGGPPLLFESMAFLDGEDIDCARYHTIDEAREGHEEMVERMRAKYLPEGCLAAFKEEECSVHSV